MEEKKIVQKGDRIQVLTISESGKKEDECILITEVTSSFPNNGIRERGLNDPMVIAIMGQTEGFEKWYYTFTDERFLVRVLKIDKPNKQKEQNREETVAIQPTVTSVETIEKPHSNGIATVQPATVVVKAVEKPHSDSVVTVQPKPREQEPTPSGYDQRKLLTSKSLSLYINERVAFTNTEKIYYCKFIKNGEISSNIILRLMEELYAAGKNKILWSKSVIADILIFIEEDVGDINVLDPIQETENINGNQRTIRHTNRNTPLSLALEIGLSDVVLGLTNNPNIDINRRWIGENGTVHHPFEKIILRDENWSMIRNGVYSQLFSNERIDLAFNEWKELFDMVIKEFENLDNPMLEDYTSAYRTLIAILTNPRFKKAESKRSGRPSKHPFGEVAIESIKMKLKKSAEEI